MTTSTLHRKGFLEAGRKSNDSIFYSGTQVGMIIVLQALKSNRPIPLCPELKGTKIKEQVQNLPDLEIPPENAYIILETDGCMEGWGGIVKWKKSKEDPRSSERICAYASGKFSTTQSTIDAEINACINTLEKLKIYYLDKQEVTLRTDCQAIISFYNKTNSNKSSRVRWIKFADAVTGTGVKINIEHIEGKHNTLADSLSRLVNLCFAGCTGEMKELAAAALYSVEEVLKSPNTSQKNMKTTCEEVMKISNHFLESSQKLSSQLKNQEHYTNITSSRPTKPQSEWINLMHGDQSLKTSNLQQQKKQLKPCDTYKQPYNTKLKSALGNQPKITTGPIKEKMLEFKIKKPEESSLNWKPWHKDWDAITSNYSKDNDNTINDDDKYRYNSKDDDNTINNDNRYRYNRKGFLEDDERSDDSIFIVDPGWDDYSLQTIKSNRPISLCPEARRARNMPYCIISCKSSKTTTTTTTTTLVTSSFRSIFNKKGDKVKVPTFIVPATQKVWMDLYTLPVPGSGGKTCSQIFEQAGCESPSSPSCGACVGGPLDIYARMNEPQAIPIKLRKFVFPLTESLMLTASALTGLVTDPREFMH
ncbi:putative polyprotein [Tanacetum coccineum]